MDMAVITQLYCQIYIRCQLHVSAKTIFGHRQFGYNYRRKIHNIWYSITTSVVVSWCKCRWLYCITYCLVFSYNCIQSDDGQKYYWLKHLVDMLCVFDNIVVLGRSCPCIIVSLCQRRSFDEVD